ncbi:MAG TPA: ribosome small subunit-dependent GTPase A [Sphingomonadales bacterium]|nr:ribosome small subunit-dependent GTPase A [Sphingomonadales bacterium]
MPIDIPALTSLGWSAFYQQQLTSEEYETTYPCRVMAVHRGQLILSMGTEEFTLSFTGKMLQEQGDHQATIGDWLLVSRTTGAFLRLLDRKSLIKRKSAGTDNSQQLVAANIDTLFIVTSCNDDFNLSRLERYLAFAYGANVDPVIVLTKQDMCDNPMAYVTQARTLGPLIMAEAVNALDPSTLAALHVWCKPGQTIALLGSSGVGKSTLANGLGATYQKTGDIRENDAKGRHTTTHRSLLRLTNGAVLLDSPGMRGLGLADCEEGVSAVFKDIADLAQACRFKDCNHDQEPGCAVNAALMDQSLSARRLKSYNKLMAEQQYNAATIAERRKKAKAFGKLSKKSIAAKKTGQDF